VCKFEVACGAAKAWIKRAARGLSEHNLRSALSGDANMVGTLSQSATPVPAQPRRRLMRRFGLSVVVAACAAALSGCATEGVEINGGVADLLGISSNALSANQREPEVAARAPLVMPPSTKLPAPGEAAPVQTAAAHPDWPVDPDRVRAQNAAEQKQRVAAMCDDEDWMRRTKPDEFNEITQHGKLCRAGIGDMLGGLLGNETADTDS